MGFSSKWILCVELQKKKNEIKEIKWRERTMHSIYRMANDFEKLVLDSSSYFLTIVCTPFRYNIEWHCFVLSCVTAICQFNMIERSHLSLMLIRLKLTLILSNEQWEMESVTLQTDSILFDSQFQSIAWMISVFWVRMTEYILIGFCIELIELWALYPFKIIVCIASSLSLCVCACFFELKHQFS